MEATYMMADLFLAAQTAQVESSVNVMEVSVMVITLALILALFFYIRLIHKNTDSDFMNIKHYCPVKILDLEINRVDHHPLGR